MQGKVISALIAVMLISVNLFAQNPVKVGLTLSGGGAKGLAHIGILQAIDSAGLNIDYLSGTSMGSIMGALYSVGYSGNEIEEIARKMDWGTLFSGKPLLENVNITEKYEFNNYAVEVPFEKGKMKIGTGLIEAQEVWVLFNKLFLPVYNMKDFDQFSIPFRCIATDLGTGKAVVLGEGEIVTAIRASMAIPSIFTAIDYENTKLIDGGVVRNFPVRDAVAMGANYAIGVKISDPLTAVDELTSAIDVLYQIGFYKDADDFQHELKLCNMLIEPPLKDYSAASFGSADEIIAIGKEYGKKYYPMFKHLADSLRAIDPTYTFRTNRLPKVETVVVDEITIIGLENTSKKSFMHNLNLAAGDTCNGEIIGEGIRKNFGSKNYKRINYSWEPTAPGHARLHFRVIENPLNTFKLGLHYNSFSKIALITGVETKNLLFDRSKSTLKLNISENYRVLLQHSQAFGKRDNNNLIFTFYLESFEYPKYIDFQATYLYRNFFYQFDSRLQHTFNLRSALGVGTSFESLNLNPKIFGDVRVEGGTSFLNSYLYYDRNTIDIKHFPTRGMKLHISGGYIYNQKPDPVFVEASELTATIDTLSYGGYGQLLLNLDHYSRINSKWTLIKELNGGINFNEEQSYLNYFYVGGMTDFLRQQVTFAGLNEYEVYTNSVASGLLGVRYNPYKSIYAGLRVNLALIDFAESTPDEWTSDNLLSGYAATISYNSGIGPIEFSLLYCDQSKSFSGYINVGYHF